MVAPERRRTLPGRRAAASDPARCGRQRRRRRRGGRAAAAGGAARLACADITSMDEAAQTVQCSTTATIGPLTKCSGPRINSPVSSKACPDEVFGDCPPGCDLVAHVVDPWGQPLAAVASIVVVGIFVGSVYIPLRDTRMKRAEEEAADVLESGENPIAESDDEDGDGGEESADSPA